MRSFAPLRMTKAGLDSRYPDDYARSRMSENFTFGDFSAM